MARTTETLIPTKGKLLQRPCLTKQEQYYNRSDNVINQKNNQTSQQTMHGERDRERNKDKYEII